MKALICTSLAAILVAGTLVPVSSIFDDLHGPVFAVVLRETRNVDAASDIVQDVFKALLEKASTYVFADRPALDQYVFGIARKKVLRHFRTVRIAPLFTSSEQVDCADDRGAALDPSTTCETLLKKLSRSYASALRAYYLEGRSVPYYTLSRARDAAREIAFEEIRSA